MLPLFKMSITDFYNDMSPKVRKWMFLALCAFTIGILSAWTLSVSKAVNNHLVQFDAQSVRIETLESRVDSMDIDRKNQFKKLERWSCYSDRTAAQLAGLDCPIQ